MTLLLGAVELLNRAIVLRVSRIERRIDREYQAARRPVGPGARRLLLVGNSLLLDGVDEPSLSAMMPSPWELRRIVIEQTLFLDWSYGLEQLHARGGSASIEAVMLDTRQLGSDAFRGDYTAFRLIGPAQVIPFAREAGLHPTEMSRLALSSISSYYGFRIESRKVLLGALVPGMASLSATFIPNPAPSPWMADSVLIEGRITSRLARLRAESGRRGARPIVVLPPSIGDGTFERAVARAASRAGVTVLIAFQPGSYAPALFKDGFHLNADGRARFTRELGEALTALLADQGAIPTAPN